jgi:START domain
MYPRLRPRRPPAIALDITRAEALDDRMEFSSRLAALGACACLAAAAVHAQQEGGWTLIETSEGISVSRREQPGADMPAFRGQGSLRGNVLQMLSLMVDLSAVPRWACGIDEARSLGHRDDRTDYVYLYSDVPWPVRDRDMVVRRDIFVEEQAKQFRIELHCDPSRAPERAGVVRVRNCDSTFRLKRTELERTELDYVMTLDPAGHLPKWAGSWIAKHVPFKTLQAIERETGTTTSTKHYEAAVRRWSVAL